MAGRRQHYLPRLLQRGFLDLSSGEAERTWLHRRGGPPRIVSIRDVGVGEYFYSRPSEGVVTLDDIITEMEGDLGAVIEGFRAASPGTVVEPTAAARTVHHLVTRTASIRSLLTDVMTRLFEEIETLFTDPTKLAAMMGLGSTEFSPLVVEAIQDAVVRLLPPGLPPALFERMLAFLMGEKGPKMLADTSGPMRAALAQVVSTIVDEARETHNKILARDSEENAWIEALSEFAWSIEQASGLILPDPVGLASSGGGPLLPLLFTDRHSAEVVVLPVSSNRLLVGLRAGATMIDLADFNGRAAACSDNFFIAATPCEDATLQERIGTEGAGAIEETIAEALASTGWDSSLGEGQRVIAVLGGTSDEFRYSVQLADFGDEALAESLNEVIHGVVSVLARRLPLASLDGFTLAVDYPAALVGLDRGGNLPPVETTALGYGIGVAQTVQIVRDGVAKAHIVVGAGIALSWLAEDTEVRAGALNILVKMLAMIAHDAGYRDQLAGASFEPDLITSELHPAVATAPRSWYSAREGAFVAPDVGESYAGLVLDGLAYGRQAMTEARARFAETQDIAPLVRVALECVSAVLSHAADWLGHRHGLAEDAPFAGDDLPERLVPWDLGDWIELFGRDLAAIYETADGEIDIARATSTSPHVERLLWVMGLLAWPDDDTVRWLPFDPGPAPVDVTSSERDDGAPSES